VSWLVLILSGAFEAVWANALAESKGFKKPIPTIVFFVTVIISVGGLGWAMTDLPTGTAYAVWVAVGATLTTLWAMATKKEKATLAKMLLLLLLVGSVIGLKLVS